MLLLSQLRIKSKSIEFKWIQIMCAWYFNTDILLLEKWFPLQVERAYSLYYLCALRGWRFQKQNRKEKEEVKEEEEEEEEETEQQTC